MEGRPIPNVKFSTKLQKKAYDLFNSHFGKKITN